MQLLKANLDGSNPQIAAMQFQKTRQRYIDVTVAASGEDSGYLCVSGENLDAPAPEERTISCVAIAGELVTHNFPIEGKSEQRAASAH